MRKRGHSIKWNFTKYELYDLYWKQKLTLREMSNRLGCSVSVIIKKMKKYNILRRVGSPPKGHKLIRPKCKREECNNNVKTMRNKYCSVSCARTGKLLSDETKEKIRQKLEGKNNPFYGKHHTEESKEKIRKQNVGKKQSRKTKEKRRKKLKQLWKNTKYREKTIKSRKNNPKVAEAAKKASKIHNYKLQHDLEYRKKYSKSLSIALKNSSKNKGKNASRWKGGLSFEPYGLEFNEHLKEFIRNYWDRLCLLCGMSEDREKLSVHHIDYNKKHNWFTNLISLHRCCHNLTNNDREFWFKYFKGAYNK